MLVIVLGVGVAMFGAIMTIGLRWRRERQPAAVPFAPEPLVVEPVPAPRHARPTTDQIGDEIIAAIERRRSLASIRPVEIVDARPRIARGSQPLPVALRREYAEDAATLVDHRRLER